MSELWIALALLAALAGVLVLLPLRGRSRAGAADVAAADARRAENLALYRQQRAELEAAQAAGTLGGADLAAARLELDRRLLDDTAGASAAAVRAGGGRGALLACALAVTWTPSPWLSRPSLKVHHFATAIRRARVQRSGVSLRKRTRAWAPPRSVCVA